MTDDERPLPMDVPIDERARRRGEIANRVLIVLLALWIVGMTLGVLYGIGLLRKSAERLESCTTPRHECFEENRRRAVERFGGVTRAQRDASAFAAACADRTGVQGPREIQRCVLASFQQQRGNRP